MILSRPRLGIAHVCMGRGGSEAKPLWGIQSLREEYDITLLTAGHVGPNQLDNLNHFYGTSLKHDDFRVLEAPVFPGMRNNQSAAALRGSLFQRFCRKVAGQFDVLVSAYNLCDFGVPAIHLIADLSWDPGLRQQFDPMPAAAQRLIHREGCYAEPTCVSPMAGKALGPQSLRRRGPAGREFALDRADSRRTHGVPITRCSIHPLQRSFRRSFRQEGTRLRVHRAGLPTRSESKHGRDPATRT